VFATAIGRFRIRRGDHDDQHHAQLSHHQRGSSNARTFQNTVVRDWSWPCVLVFVREWYSRDDLDKHRDDLVPPFLYLPDGRVVPTCVLEERPYEGPAEAVIGVAQQAPVFASASPSLLLFKARSTSVRWPALLMTERNTMRSRTNM
jgi:hypothetical protein